MSRTHDHGRAFRRCRDLQATEVWSEDVLDYSRRSRSSTAADLNPADGSTTSESPLAHDGGRKEDDQGEAQASHARAGRAKAPRGRSVTGEGADVPTVSRHLEVSEQTYHRWRNQYGSMQADDVKRLKELEHENTPLKRIVAEALDIAALKDVAGKF